MKNLVPQRINNRELKKADYMLPALWSSSG